MATKKKIIKVNCLHENCPMPLIKTRGAINNAKKGDVIEVIGTHPNSFDEIPMALDALGLKLVKKAKNEKQWTIVFKV